MKETTPIDVTATNLAFYDDLWSRAAFCPPEKFNTWTLLSKLSDTCTKRLELGPGYRPRLPIAGTHFVDLSDVAVTKLNELGGNGHLGNIVELNFAPSSFDLIAAFDVIEHIEQHEKLFARLSELLSPSGHLCFSVPLHPDAWSEFDVVVGHCRRYTLQQISELLNENGFEVLSSAGFGMKPKSRFWTGVGMWWLKRYPQKAMHCYNNYMFPLALKRQENLVMESGLGNFDRHEGVIVHAQKVL